MHKSNIVSDYRKWQTFCNVDWYITHGYELVEEGTYEGFSRPDEEYKIYVFKMKL